MKNKLTRLQKRVKTVRDLLLAPVLASKTLTLTPVSAHLLTHTSHLKQHARVARVTLHGRITALYVHHIILLNPAKCSVCLSCQYVCSL